MADHPERQSPIDAHGIIGDMRSAALVNDKGSVDFFCWPEFDSPSIFCSLLDTPEAGIFQLSPDLPDARREQIYLPDTNVLQTRWLSDRAVVEVTDLLPVGDTEDDLPVLMRRSAWSAAAPPSTCVALCAMTMPALILAHAWTGRT